MVHILRSSYVCSCSKDFQLSCFCCCSSEMRLKCCQECESFSCMMNTSLQNWPVVFGISSERASVSYQRLEWTGVSHLGEDSKSDSPCKLTSNTDMWCFFFFPSHINEWVQPCNRLICWWVSFIYWRAMEFIDTHTSSLHWPTAPFFSSYVHTFGFCCSSCTWSFRNIWESIGHSAWRHRLNCAGVLAL